MCTHYHTNRKQYLPSSGEADLWVGYLPRREAQWENYASSVVYVEKRGHKDLLVRKEQKMKKPSLYLQRNTKMCNL